METSSALLTVCAGNSTHKGQWCGALMFSLICVWINSWVNNREAGDLRRHRAHYDVIVMVQRVLLEEDIIYIKFLVSRIKNSRAQCPWHVAKTVPWTATPGQAETWTQSWRAPDCGQTWRPVSVSVHCWTDRSSGCRTETPTASPWFLNCDQSLALTPDTQMSHNFDGANKVSVYTVVRGRDCYRSDYFITW